jgi:hypothetical protein
MPPSNSPGSGVDAMANTSEPPLFDSSIYVDQTAALLGLSIPSELRSGVISNFDQIQVIAQSVLEFSMTETIESATTFHP